MRRYLNFVVPVLLVAAFWVLTLEGISLDRRVVAAIALAGYALVLNRFKKSGTGEDHAGQDRSSDYLVAFATETGTARKLGKDTCKRLGRMGERVVLIELNRLSVATVPKKALLVIASTTGNGDAPRTGSAWLENQDCLRQYAGRQFGVLALGDRSYSRFCGFGLEVASVLREAGAQLLFDPILVHQGDPASVRYWFRKLGIEDRS